MKFEFEKIGKLTDPGRFESLPPGLIWDTLSLSSPDTLVDIGAGTGFFAMPFCDLMEVGVVYACDVSEAMLGYMRENLPERYAGRVIPVKMSETAVPLDDEIADLVYMITLHHELEDPAAIMEESFRLLKPGGTVMAIDWKKEPTPEGPPLEIRKSAREAAAQMEAAGFLGVTSHSVLPYHFFLTAKRP